MDSIALLGKVGAKILAEELSRASASAESGTARFLLDRLQNDQTIAIVQAVLGEPILSSKVFVRVPESVAVGSSLPKEVVTTERAVHFRNRPAPDGRPALLLVNTDDDQGVSLQDMTRIGAKSLTDHIDLWVDIAADGGPLPDSELEVWKAALRGLTDARTFTVGQLAKYVAAVAQRIREDALPVHTSMGMELPILQLPRDSTLAVADRQRRHRSVWRRKFEQFVNERGQLLRKKTKAGQLLEREDLLAQFLRVRDGIAQEHWPVFEAFIESPPTWNPSAEALSHLEWDSDRVDELFTGLKTKKVSLAQETNDFYHDKDPNLLDTADRDYLALLGEQTKKQPGEDDRLFYENHRSILSEKPALKAKWDRFIFGSSIECHDLLVGLLNAMHRLKEQVPNWSGKKSLAIEWNARGRTQQLAVNADVATLFSLRYRGLQELCGTQVTWNVGPLFAYEKFLEDEKARTKRYQRNESSARAALRIRLDVRLAIEHEGGVDEYAVQVEYVGRPDAVSANLASDLKHIVERPYADLSVQRVLTSKKGRAQRIALEDAGSFESASGRDSGALVPALRNVKSFEKSWEASLKGCLQRVSQQDHQKIQSAWSVFQQLYPAALSAFAKEGICAAALMEQAGAYAKLLRTLEPHLRDDVVRRDLLLPLLRIGVVIVDDQPAAAVIAPWNPLRLAAIAIKARSVGNLFKHMLAVDSVDVGDARLFFQDLAAELSHPYYPEVAVGFSGGDPELLVVTDSLDDYSLAEVPSGVVKTNENPAEGAQRVRDIVGRYLELQPHENASLSVALFECDSAGLPLAAVGALTTLQESEVHCNVTLRHRDRKSLQRVYNELLEQSEGDADALVASETSRNFMAKLRVGIHVDPPGKTRDNECREVDIAYLQDVVARRARVRWLEAPIGATAPSLLTHVPPRWAYKVPTTSDATTRYLACPEQPEESAAYLASVAAVIERQPVAAGHRKLPARSISLADGQIKQAFEDAHNLAEWVVNYDDLLDPEQLRHQSIRVIRYQKDRSNGRNIIVSSTARSKVLEVLLRRRVEELGVQLSSEQRDHLVRLLIDRAISISGDIVLRASKRGVSAGELIGVVLSASMAQDELGGAPSACFFLDDYAAWLGQKETGIADLLFMSFDPEVPNRVRVIVTEAKYVGSAGAADGKKTSRRQIEATVAKINDALFENPGRLDRDFWLARLSDLLLDAVKSPIQERQFDEMRRRIREGNVELDVRGYSHIFVTDDKQNVSSEQEPLPIQCGPHSVQETFGLAHTRQLLQTLVKGTSLRSIRSEIGSGRPWEEMKWRTPAARAEWMQMVPARVKSSTSENVSVLPSGDAAESAIAPPVMPLLEAELKNIAIPSTSGRAIVPQSFDDLVVAKSTTDGSDANAIEWLESAGKVLQRALVGWGYQAKILGTRLTPNAGLVRLLGSDRLETKDIESNRHRLLTTHSLNVLSVTPRPGEIVVAIERPNRQIVSLWNVWARTPSRRRDEINLSFIVGIKELDGEILFINLGGEMNGQPSHAPHTLIAGTTGSGKSILIQNLLVDIALTNDPSLAKIYCIDPKMGVDYVALDGLPHLAEPIIVDQDRAISVLEGLVAEMDDRYRRFAAAKVPNLRTFNERVAAVERLPAIFVVHDEFAEWMLTESYRDAVSATVKRLGVKARAAGIHLFFAAQRPDKDVLPPQLRDNLGNRLILRVEGEGTSEIALGQKGAERLLGKGHCAARLQNEPDLIYAQVPWIGAADVSEVVQMLKRSAGQVD